ncbi:molybdenum cofactor biosynthesis protein D/E [Bryobacterales bacterium F-183]|nr:molybdenum cofactor biosynthesis protein D/E [Bryobacterales bacterium F-183]
MRVRVLFFGLLRDVVGKSEDTRDDLPPSATLASVFAQYAAEFPKLKDLEKSLVFAHNQSFAPRDTPIADGDEIAFLPPVSGGTGTTQGSPYLASIEDPEGHFFALTEHPIDSKPIVQRLVRGEDGAYVEFQGVVRNNSKGRATRYLDYECYQPLALKVLAEIGRDIASKYEVGRVALVHRLGRMEIGEASVAVIVASPHRRAAFDAALEGINRLKKTVPIWKKEYFVDGEVWVEGEWDESLPRG